MLEPRYYAAVCSLGKNRIAILGGQRADRQNLRDVNIYDCTSQSVEKQEEGKCGFISAVTMKDAVYALGMADKERLAEQLDEDKKELLE